MNCSWIGLLVLPFLAVVSCRNDDDDAIPVIHYIRVTDPAKKLIVLLLM